ncbi:AraC family transcriptional regulator [Vibrio sp. SCSIO 43135]|uniref:AraC family transcriptional regulator n=1 Tax=Vibrio sp. SCSIO 43135 TaxID=2819096 RepID=UPI002075C29F|nr:AraC family transcriptional regulator [Vibrio sp. SCSIO 43135]USD42110.1 AraC family transcriptional regulator [Vibrio sp. SCSIO 43135]
MVYSAEYEPDMQACGMLDIHLLYRYLGTRIPMEQLLEGTHVQPSQLYTPDSHITLAQKLVIFGNALSQSNEPGIGLRIGQQARFSDFGVLGYAVFSSNTLMDALIMGFKYLRLAGPVLRKEMWVEKDVGYFRANQLVELDSLLPFCSEYWFSAIQSLIEEVMQQPFPSKVIHFPFPKPEYGDLYEQIFHCPIVFDSDRLEWQFDATNLDNPLPSANAITLQSCLKSCDEMLAKVVGNTSLTDKITQIFLEQPGHYPSIDTVSSQLGMSSRTLRRKLSSEQNSYQAILDHVRFQLARHYLTSTQMSIEEVSDRIGFSDSANFRHAFRKWCGLSPREFRQQAQQDS